MDISDVGSAAMEPLRNSVRMRDDARALRAASRQAVHRATHLMETTSERLDRARNVVQASYLLRTVAKLRRNGTGANETDSSPR
jgi:hypothetical protein